MQVKDGEGNPVDLTDADLRWVLARRPGEDPVIEKADGDGITVDDASEGEFTVHLDPSDTEGLVGYFVHEADVTLDDGQVSSVLTGRAAIQPSAIRGV